MSKHKCNNCNQCFSSNQNLIYHIKQKVCISKVKIFIVHFVIKL